MSRALADATAGALLEEAVAVLEAARLEHPRIDAEWLLAAVLGARRFAAYVEPRRALGPHQVERYRALIGRRAQREPLQHLLGYEDFCGLRLEVTADVLIPRPETETLVEWALAVLRDRPGACRVADVGTGSGAIACALASRLAAVDVVALDCSRTALAVAYRNLRAHGLADRVRLIEGDLVAPLEAAPRFDLVIANLPYLESARIDSLPGEVSRWEPRLALDGGPDGLALLRRLVVRAPRVLADGGWLLLEIGDRHAQPLAALMAVQGFTAVQSRRDLNGVERHIGGRWLTEGRPARERSC